MQLPIGPREIWTCTFPGNDVWIYRAFSDESDLEPQLMSVHVTWQFCNLSLLLLLLFAWYSALRLLALSWLIVGEPCAQTLRTLISH